MRRPIGLGRGPASVAISAAGALAAPAMGQTGGTLDLSWSTIDCGGGTSSGGTLALSMTMGQPDAYVMSGGALVVSGGFWSVPPGGVSCYANCDGSTSVPVLNVSDFTCFLQKFAQGCP